MVLRRSSADGQLVAEARGLEEILACSRSVKADPIAEYCNCPINENGPMVYCGKKACKFFISTAQSALPHMHPRCDDHWRGTALPTSPYVIEVSEEEFAVWRVMLA